ncbi:MAG: hypothetical protein SGCHY_003934 [Lobulomycetales sp.]
MSVLPVALPLIILLRVDSLYADPQSEPFRLSLALVLALLLTTRRSFPQALAACASLFVITLSLMLLFGAYITRRIPQTIGAALLISLLVTFSTILLSEPAALSKGIRKAVISLDNPVLLCTGLGVWAGAIVLPLDWQKPYQEYPVSLVMGAFLGNWIASVAVYLRHKLEQ